MRITLLLLFVLTFQLQAEHIYSQDTKISLNLKNSTIEKVLQTIEEKSDYYFLYNNRLINVDRKVSVRVRNAAISAVLERLFKSENVDYEVKGTQIILSPKEMYSQISVVTEALQQKKAITGTVVDATGAPVIGANIIEKGTTNGTVTDIDGNFVLRVEEDAVIHISYIGYLDQEIPTVDRTYVSVILKEDARVLEEIVVVGYGTQKKINLTGSVETVKGKELAKRPVTNTSLALQGLASGVTVTSTSGRPGGEGASVRIRGIGTFNSNDPLVLIDGASASLNDISPNDIENISILKDAASASIYGSRAANGVILITTKRAQTGKFNINFNTNFGLQTPVDLPKFLGAIDYLELYDLAASNDNRNPNTGAPGGVVYGSDYIENYKRNMATDPFNYPDTDWQKICYKSPALQQLYNLSLSGGTEKLQAFVALNIQDQDGILPSFYLKRYSLRANTDYHFSEKFSIGIDLSGRYTLINQAQRVTSDIVRTAPIMPYITPAGNPAFFTLGSNAWAYTQEKYSGYQRSWYQEGMVNFKATYTPFKTLRFDFSYVPKLNFSTSKNFTNQISFYSMDEKVMEVLPQQRSLSIGKTYNKNEDLKFLISFDEAFGKHNFHAFGGFQQITNYAESLSAYREKSQFEYEELSSFPALNQTGTGSANEWALQSYFGRLNYNYDEKYLFEINTRHDGSSRFGRGYKWGLFPSFSAGWRFTQEKFMSKLAWLSDGKIRASWGQLGNQDGLGSNYPFSMDININQPVIFNQMVADGYASTDYAVADISWETTEMSNIGLNLGFLQNKLEVVFDYYVKNTKNILLNMNIPGVMGYSNAPKQNVGQIENKGWDLEVIYNDKIDNFSYRVAASLSDVKNKIVDMKGIINNHNNIMTNQEGYPINSLWGLQADGLFSSFTDAKSYNVRQFGNLQGGDIKYVDQPTVDTDGDGIPDSGDGVITGEDYVIMGNTIPRYTYSLNLSMEYKDFDLGLFFQGVGKKDQYIRHDLAWAFNNAGKIQRWQKDGMWQEGQTDAKYPRLFIASENNIKPSTFWKENGAYLRLKNLQFGYSVPKNKFKNSFIKGARIYFSGDNLFTLKHMKEGHDPEQDENLAVNYLTFTKTYSFGFNLNF